MDFANAFQQRLVAIIVRFFLFFVSFSFVSGVLFLVIVSVEFVILCCAMCTFVSSSVGYVVACYFVDFCYHGCIRGIIGAVLLYVS